jgi:hypothetical protein
MEGNFWMRFHGRGFISLKYATSSIRTKKKRRRKRGKIKDFYVFILLLTNIVF